MPPERPFPALGAVPAALERTGGLAGVPPPGRARVPIALDGTESYFRPARVHRRRCSKRARGGGEEERRHTLPAATLVAPGHERVVCRCRRSSSHPRTGTPSGTARAGPAGGGWPSTARGWLAEHGPGLARLAPVHPGDDLFACQPLRQAVRAAGGRFPFVAEPASHPTLTEDLTGIEPPRHEVGHRGRGRTPARGAPLYRWLEDVPVRDGADAPAVNRLRIEILDGAGKLTRRDGFVTDLPVSAATVAGLAACGRARWKIGNEGFNVLRTKGHHLEHNFGHGRRHPAAHGRRHPAAVLATLNRLAFACHTPSANAPTRSGAPPSRRPARASGPSGTCAP